MQSSAASAPPIFILGIRPRCGTNFLFDLLRLHPDCRTAQPIWEDFLVHHADLLDRYVHAVYRHWQRADRDQMDTLYQCLGQGLLGFLTPGNSGKRLVTKTPSVDNIEYFFKLFPNAYLLILIRDGRSVVESAVKSFGVNYERARHQWAEAARTIQHFDQTAKPFYDNYLIVRYEELWQDLPKELFRIFDFVGLDTKKYSFEDAADLPVRGSSELRHQSSGELHWKGEKKKANFDPTKRWNHWSRLKHERFNWISGSYLDYFGYNQQHYSTYRLLFVIWNCILDLRWVFISSIVKFSLLKPYWYLCRMARKRTDMSISTRDQF